MDSASSPNPWSPYDTYKDCSQGICSPYCLQWCYIISPPPPSSDNDNDHDSGTDFSPLIIALIGIFASVFLLLTYYTIISKYCRRRGRNNPDPTVELEENRGQIGNESWQQDSNSGLDESLIRSIKVCRYKNGDQLVDGKDCSVCLSEFQEGESIRLLPKCNHAFHLPCIDTWLKSSSSCPLCRSNITSTNPPPPPRRPPAQQIQQNMRAAALEHRYGSETVSVIEDLERGFRVEEAVVVAVNPDRASTEDSSRQRRVMVADILCGEEEDEDEAEIGAVEPAIESGSSTRNNEELSKLNSRFAVLNLVRKSLAMKDQWRSLDKGEIVL